MKRALIIAGCGGLLAALIIGAGINAHVPDYHDANDFFDNKCSAPSETIDHPSACGSTYGRAGDEIISEIFLREIKRKARRAYA